MEIDSELLKKNKAKERKVPEKDFWQGRQLLRRGGLERVLFGAI